MKPIRYVNNLFRGIVEPLDAASLIETLYNPVFHNPLAGFGRRVKGYQIHFDLDTLPQPAQQFRRSRSQRHASRLKQSKCRAVKKNYKQLQARAKA